MAIGILLLVLLVIMAGDAVYLMYEPGKRVRAFLRWVAGSTFLMVFFGVILFFLAIGGFLSGVAVGDEGRIPVFLLGISVAAPFVRMWVEAFSPGKWAAFLKRWGL